MKQPLLLLLVLTSAFAGAIFLESAVVGTKVEALRSAYVTEICFNGVDDDGDELADEQDPDCPNSVESALQALALDDDAVRQRALEFLTDSETQGLQDQDWETRETVVLGVAQATIDAFTEAANTDLPEETRAAARERAFQILNHMRNAATRATDLLESRSLSGAIVEKITQQGTELGFFPANQAVIELTNLLRQVAANTSQSFIDIIAGGGTVDATQAEALLDLTRLTAKLSLDATRSPFDPDEQAKTLEDLKTAAATLGAPIDQLVENLKLLIDDDSDDDGMPDSWEQFYDVGEPDTDDDADGLTNLQEFAAGTVPTDPDTDGDGVPDGLDTNPVLFVGTPVDVGANVSVPLGVETLVAFPQVTLSGQIDSTYSIIPLASPPAGFGFLGYFFHMSTTAQFAGPVTVTVPYGSVQVIAPPRKGPEEDLRLFYFGDSGWEDITLSVDILNDTVTGESNALGAFVIGETFAVGGTAELLVGDSDAPSENAGSSGDSKLPIAAAVVGGLLIALANGGLFVRRRLAR